MSRTGTLKVLLHSALVNYKWFVCFFFFFNGCILETNEGKGFIPHRGWQQSWLGVEQTSIKPVSNNTIVKSLQEMFFSNACLKDFPHLRYILGSLWRTDGFLTVTNAQIWHTTSWPTHGSKDVLADVTLWNEEKLKRNHPKSRSGDGGQM